MKIIEAMKEMRIIEKKMQRKIGSINSYAALVSCEIPHFGTEDKQRKEVQSMIQANMDLYKRYLFLKRGLEITNLKTEITVEGYTATIADFLVMKRKLANLIMNTFAALSDEPANQRMRQMPTVEGQRLHVKRLYDEKDKLEAMRKWMDIFEGLDSKLEVINATTELYEEF